MSQPGERAKHDTAYERDEKRGQSQQQSRSKPLENQLVDWPPLAKRIAQIEGDDLCKVSPQLGNKGLVEPVFRSQLIQELLVGGTGLTCDNRGRISGSGMDQGKIDRGNDEDRSNDPRQFRQQTPDNPHQAKYASLKFAFTPIADVITSLSWLSCRVG